MPYWVCFFHVVWATRMREPILRPEEYGIVTAVIRSALESERIVIHAVGCMPDHVHVAASIPPSQSVSGVVQRWKGSASHLVNHNRGFVTPRFAWQAEYGVHTFGKNALPRVLDYVNHQAEHHGNDALWPGLERIVPDSLVSPEGTSFP